ncbi:hypothetical protein DPMN_002001 [Dreissena polymorpha]|uniref:Uncharacterized protein n=1 Tax=Dreissena polymorpha TaxID=45954 RepID=A0A9D4RTK2_DREPO|nr:hypothetical protein DPMN_002001 [Dreissena polymorpha]
MKFTSYIHQHDQLQNHHLRRPSHQTGGSSQNGKISCHSYDTMQAASRCSARFARLPIGKISGLGCNKMKQVTIRKHVLTPDNNFAISTLTVTISIEQSAIKATEK